MNRGFFFCAKPTLRGWDESLKQERDQKQANERSPEHPWFIGHCEPIQPNNPRQQSRNGVGYVARLHPHAAQRPYYPKRKDGGQQKRGLARTAVVQEPSDYNRECQKKLRPALNHHPSCLFARQITETHDVGSQREGTPHG